MLEETLGVPWNDPANFPKPAASSAYGYRKDASNHPMSPEQLVRDIEKDTKKEIELVWTPESPRLVPAEEVDFLYEAVIARNKYNLRSRSVSTFFRGLLFSAPFTLSLLFGQGFSSYGFLLFIIFLAIPMADLGVEWLYQRRMDPTKLQAQASSVRFSHWAGQQKGAYGSIILGALIIIIGIGQWMTGLDHSANAAGLVKSAVRAGELWRLVTTAFLHVSFWHFGLNLLALLGLGRLIEILTHRAWLPIVFLASVVGGSLFSLYLMPDTNSIGASGGIMGLLGFLIILGWRNRRELPPRFLNDFISIVAWTLLAGVAAWGLIDNAAHVGGFLVGCLIGLVCFRKPRQQFLQKHYSFWGYVLGVIVGIVLLAFAAWTVYQFMLPRHS